jgi:hypothetical protein
VALPLLTVLMLLVEAAWSGNSATLLQASVVEGMLEGQDRHGQRRDVDAEPS